MGQATLDLPDPLNDPKTVPLASADDLLSQLAGDEIDRLLADADGDPPAAPPADWPTTEPTAQDQAAASSEIDEVFEKLAPAPGEPESSPLNAPATVNDAPSSAANHPAAAESVAGPVADEELEREIEAASAERAALAGGRASPQVDLMSDAGVEPHLPVVFKPLVWLSAPLDAFPDEVRETLGKIAILTLVNAVAALAYVVLFRRH